MILLPKQIGAVPWRSTMTVDRCVYVLRTPSGFYKIGITNDPTLRLQSLQVGCPERIEFVGCTQIADDGESGVSAITAEYRIHSALRPYRATGEWFKPPSHDVVLAAWKYAFYTLQRRGFAKRYERRWPSSDEAKAA